MALRYQADTQTKPLGANANTPLQGNTAFKDGQLAEVILLITGRFTVGEGYNGIHKLFQQLLEEFVDAIVAFANGKPTCNEQNDFRELAIFKSGVTL